jgi:hypothetical protein
MPVSFVLFKSLYHRVENSLIHFKELLTPVGYESKQQSSKHLSAEDSAPRLPANIPGGIITGLRSFVQKGSKPSTRPTENPKANESVSTYVELQSIDYERFGRSFDNI